MPILTKGTARGPSEYELQVYDSKEREARSGREARVAGNWEHEGDSFRGRKNEVGCEPEAAELSPGRTQGRSALVNVQKGHLKEFEPRTSVCDEHCGNPRRLLAPAGSQRNSALRSEFVNRRQCVARGSSARLRYEQRQVCC